MIRHQLFYSQMNNTRFVSSDATRKQSEDDVLCIILKDRKIRPKRLSKKEHRADALAPEAEEGRDKLRKATGRSKYLMIRGYPNGGTHLGRS